MPGSCLVIEKYSRAQKKKKKTSVLIEFTFWHGGEEETNITCQVANTKYAMVHAIMVMLLVFYIE